jgi:hypothetical protein
MADLEILDIESCEVQESDLAELSRAQHLAWLRIGPVSTIATAQTIQTQLPRVYVTGKDLQNRRADEF